MKRKNNPLINGEPYQLVVLRVMKFDGTGRPSEVTIGWDDTTFNISEETPNNFITAYVPSRVIASIKNQRH